MDSIEKRFKKLELVNHWISNVDTKSSFVLTFYGVILTIVFASELGNKMINTFGYKCATEVNGESIKLFFSLIVVIAFFIVVIITFYNIYQTLKGRADPKLYKQKGLQTDSNLFFGTIATKKYADFKEQTKDEKDKDLLNDLNSQVYINSIIANAKFKYYNRSIIWLIISFILFLIFMIIN
jgi:cell division protein FtsW (lipid II flippase)